MKTVKKTHDLIYFLKKMSLVVEKADLATELTKQINVMEAVYWISHGMKQLPTLSKEASTKLAKRQ